MGVSCHLALALSVTAGTSCANPDRSESSKDSTCGSDDGRCTPMVARPPLMDTTTFSSTGASAFASASALYPAASIAVMLKVEARQSSATGILSILNTTQLTYSQWQETWEPAP